MELIMYGASLIYLGTVITVSSFVVGGPIAGTLIGAVVGAPAIYAGYQVISSGYQMFSGGSNGPGC